MHPRAGSEERRVRRNNVIPEGLDGTRRGRGFLEVGEVTVIDRPQESFGHRRWAAEVDEVRSLGEREEVVPPSERGEEFDPEIQQVEAVEVVLVAEESESVESILLEAGANRHVKVAEDPADGRWRRPLPRAHPLPTLPHTFECRPDGFCVLTAEFVRASACELSDTRLDWVRGVEVGEPPAKGRVARSYERRQTFAQGPELPLVEGKTVPVDTPVRPPARQHGRQGFSFRESLDPVCELWLAPGTEPIGACKKAIEENRRDGSRVAVHVRAPKITW